MPPFVRSLAALAFTSLCSGAIACSGDAASTTSAASSSASSSSSSGAGGAGGAGGRGGAGGVGGAPVTCAKSGAWTAVGALTRGRYAAGFAVLQGGRALVAGGWDAQLGAQGSAVFLDAASDALTPAGKLGTARNFPAVAPLPHGFLFAGGFNDSLGSVRAADVWDDTTQKLAPTGQLVEARELFTATALPDGRVLVAGGLSAAGLKVRTTAELYDPKTSAFTLAKGKPVEARFGQGALWVPKVGKVFLVGGKTIGPNGDVGRATAEWFDPATETFAIAGKMSAARDRPVVELLDDDTILVAGGANPTDKTLDSTELFSIAKGAFTAGPNMTTRRMAHAAARLVDGTIVVVGGWSDSSMPAASSASAELFDPIARKFVALPSLKEPRHDAAAIAVRDCSVVVLGGLRVEGMQTTTPLGVERLEL